MEFIENGIRYSRVADGKVSVGGFGLNTDSAVVQIPRYINGYRVVWISPAAFAENHIIEKVYIPDTICLIGENAFYKCINLKTVKMTNENVTFQSIGQDAPLEIRKSAFSGCKNLTEFISLKNIFLNGNSVFKNCFSLTEMAGRIYGNLPDKSFFKCWSLSDFSFYDQTTQIGTDCFYECVGIKDFYLLVDLELNEEFFATFKDCVFHCLKNSKYANLAYHGVKIKIFDSL